MQWDTRLRRWWHPYGAQGRVLQPLLLASWLASGYMVTRFYKKLLNRHGSSPQALAERADQKSATFYDHLFQNVVMPDPLSVLDIGCGMGDVIPYLHQQNRQIAAYVGIDLVADFVRLCQRHYSAPYRFYQANFVHPAFRPSERFTVVLNMGGMVSRVMWYEDYLAYSCAKMLNYATHAVVFNVITEVQSDSTNYPLMDRVGQITTIAKPRLMNILDRVTRGTGWAYALRDARIYPDGVDTFVYLFPRRQ